MSTSRNEFYRFGSIVGTHGLKGDLKVRPISPGFDALQQAGEVLLQSAAGGETKATPVRTVPHKGNVLLRLENLEDINLVQHLVGSDVLVPRPVSPGPESGRYDWQDLEGIEVIDRRCGVIGTLENVFTTAAHDIYVVQGPFGEVLMPVVEQFICSVDLSEKRMTVDLPEGLVPDSDEH